MTFDELCYSVSYQLNKQADDIKFAFAFTETNKHPQHKDFADLNQDFSMQLARIEISTPNYQFFNPNRKIDFSLEFTVDKKPINILGFSNNQLIWEFRETKKEEK